MYNIHNSLRGDVNDIIKQPIAITITSIDDNILEDFYEKYRLAHQTGQEFLPVLINSDGGNTYAMSSIISHFNNSKIPIVTIGTGRMFSAALILLSFGTPGYRYCDPNSIGFMHEFSSLKSEKEATSSIMKFESECLKRENNNMYKKMALACGQKQGFFLDLIKSTDNKEIYMTPKQMKMYGIIDYIKLPSFSITIDVNYNIN